jgi:serine/threonine protein kinase
LYTESENTSQKFALKLFPLEDPKFLLQFDQESRFSYLRHPSIILFIDSKSHEDPDIQFEYEGSYLLMELGCLDLNHVINFTTISEDEKLVRSYFHQLIDAIDFLSKNKISHRDLKPENLVLDPCFQLKVIDFGNAFKVGDNVVNGRGTSGYRAPEVIESEGEDYSKSDIYTAGVVLFVMMTGLLPYDEVKKVEGWNLYDLIGKDERRFWSVTEKVNEKARGLCKDFREKFIGMIEKDPRKRMTLERVRESRWYGGEVYEKEEVSRIMKNLTKHIFKRED